MIIEYILTVRSKIKNLNLKIIIFCILITLIVIITTYNFRNVQYKKWYQCKKGDSVSKVFHNILNSNGLVRSYDENDWDVLLPCNSGYSEKEFKKIKTNNSQQIVSFVSRNGVIGSKEFLWKILIKKFDRDFCCSIMPPSYIFPSDKDLLLHNHNKNKLYVMKSEAQRQSGLEITNDIDKMLNHRKNGFKIIQEYIHNPLKYRGHKINIRIYLLVMCTKWGKYGYVFDDGIVSYAKKNYGDEINFENGVASFYTSKKLYDKGYPIIFSQLKREMNSVNWNKIVKNFNSKISLVLDAAKYYLCSNKLTYHNSTFQLFGVDFMLTKNLKPYILEINIGPGMEPYNSIDRQMRYKLHRDMFATVGIIDNIKNNGFYKIFSNSSFQL